MSVPRRNLEVLRDLPIDIDSEKDVIACLLQKPALLRDDNILFSVDDFYLPSHKKIVEAIIDLDAEGIVPDPGMVAHKLIDQDVERNYIDEISLSITAPSNAIHYIKKLHGAAIARQALFDADEYRKAALSGITEDIARVRAKISKALTQKEKSEWRKCRIDISRSAIVNPPSQKFIVGHLPDEPGNYGLIIGPDGVRKSWLALHIALAVAGGRPVAQGPDGTSLWSAPQAGRVVYITSEDSPDVMWRRVWNIGQMPGYHGIEGLDERLDIFPVFSNMALLSTTQDGSIVQTPEYKELIEYAQGSRLIIIDPLADVFDLDENGNREGRAIVQALRQLSLRTGAGVLGVHHQNKASMLAGEKNHQSGRGSSKFGAGCRWAVVLQPLSQIFNSEDTEEIGITGQEADWTLVHESKASYADEVAGDRWFHKVAVVDDDGHLIASAPLAAKLPEEKKRFVSPVEKKEKEKKTGGEYVTAY